ncbi:uncharacterized protein PHACADRAFT_65139, partial [Phanerochaete carnosa HHB-10118-sp]
FLNSDCFVCHRCFPHIINIAVKAGLKMLTKVQNDWHGKDASRDDDTSWQRRRDLRQAIALSMAAKRALIAVAAESLDSSTSGPKPKELLRDVDTRWSALFMMIDRALKLYEAVEAFLNMQKQNDIRKSALDEMELRVLHDIHRFLHVFHCIQQLLSYEKTPTLPLSIPMYESLLEALRALRSKLCTLEHAINASIGRLHKYLSIARKSKAYALAMGE